MTLSDVEGDVVEEGGEVGDEGELVGAEDKGGLNFNFEYFFCSI